MFRAKALRLELLEGPSLKKSILSLCIFSSLHPYQRKLAHLIGTTYNGKDS